MLISPKRRRYYESNPLGPDIGRDGTAVCKACHQNLFRIEEKYKYVYLTCINCGRVYLVNKIFIRELTLD